MSETGGVSWGRVIYGEWQDEGAAVLFTDMNDDSGMLEIRVFSRGLDQPSTDVFVDLSAFRSALNNT